MFTGAELQPVAERRSARSRAGESLVDDIRLFEEVSGMLTGGDGIGDSGGELLRDDLLDNGEPAREIVPIHYERGKNPERVLTRRQQEKAFVPPALYYVTRGFDDVESPDKAESAYRANSP